MSQSTPSKKGRPAPQPSRLPAIVSAIVVVGIFIVLGIVLSSNRPGTAQTGAVATPDAFATAPAQSTAAALPTSVAESGRKTYSALPPMTIDVQKTYTATITTPRGDIVIKLRPDLAPQTVNSFVFLAKEGFYNGLTWHRVLPNFMAQGGDPTGTGSGGPGYSVPDEFTDKVLFDRPGLVAMAHSALPNSNGSQFFITTGPAPHLNNQYTIFGEVIQGQEIVSGIPLRNPDQNPTTSGEQIVKITISEGS